MLCYIQVKYLCKLMMISRENITRDFYIYLEEAKALRKFDFYPQTFIDIEKPASVS